MSHYVTLCHIGISQCGSVLTRGRLSQSFGFHLKDPISRWKIPIWGWQFLAFHIDCLNVQRTKDAKVVEQTEIIQVHKVIDTICQYEHLLDKQTIFFCSLHQLLLVYFSWMPWFSQSGFLNPTARIVDLSLVNQVLWGFHQFWQEIESCWHASPFQEIQM